jgi:MFS family permease
VLYFFLLADLALMSGAQLFIREDLGLSDAQIEVLAGSINVFMLMSILAAGWAADLLGRRGTLVLANVFLMAGALAMSLGASYPALMAARCITSVGSGFSIVVTSVYNAEISPASMRGFLSSFLDVCVCKLIMHAWNGTSKLHAACFVLNLISLMWLLCLRRCSSASAYF